MLIFGFKYMKKLFLGTENTDIFILLRFNGFCHIFFILATSCPAKTSNVLQKYKMPNSLWDSAQSRKPAFHSQFCQVLCMFPSSSQPLFYTYSCHSRKQTDFTSNLSEKLRRLRRSSHRGGARNLYSNCHEP